jgi:hypothetical protein
MKWASQLAIESGPDPVVFATCPITELGFVRVGSGSAGYAASVEAARADLRTVLIPDETAQPLMVREEAIYADWAMHQIPEASDRSGSRGITIR